MGTSTKSPPIMANRSERIDLRVSEELKDRIEAEVIRVSQEIGVKLTTSSWMIMVIEGKAKPLSSK